MPEATERSEGPPRLRHRADPYYRKLWLGDWRVVLAANGAAAGSQVELVVITAPGATPPPGEPFLPGVNCLPWDESKCAHGNDVKCSGKLGCVVQVDALDAWNRTAPERWTALHRAAATRTRRKLGGKGFRLAFRAWEPQRRGALHMNAVPPVKTARQMAAAATYRRELSQLAPRYGFGFVDRKKSVKGALHAARYLAKYLSEGGEKMGIGDLAARGDCPRVIVRVDPTLTRATGVTMRSRRANRGLFLLARDLDCTLEQAREIRIESGRKGRQRWASCTRSGRSSLPWDVQLGLAEWERQAQDAVSEWLGHSERVVWPIPPRRPVEGVDF